LAYDRGRITAGPHGQAIHELELELKQGSDADLADAVLAFLDRVPAGLQTLGKAARGFQLATGDTPQPVFQEKQRISADTVLPEAVALILRSAFAQALANQAAVVATEAPEAVHQMRVGLRRLRSIVAAFRPVLDLSATGDLLERTKAFFSLLGDVREADVFLTETVDTFPQSHGGGERHAVLVREVERFRDQARKRMIAHAAGPEFARLALGWLRWIEGGDWLRNDQPLDRLLQTRPVGAFAAGRLESLTRKLVKRGHRALTGSVDDWHAARIAAKKLRYAGGPLLTVVDHEAGLKGTAQGSRRATKRLARLQDELGRFNDLCNVPLLLDRVAASVPPGSRPAFAVAAAYCGGWCDARVAHAIPRLETTWQAFEAAMKGPA
ncbi:MAG: CHAD domain-containing protein, partial [Alphaproteobacteria bacterium]|nr:CHAD domain-containing protein [Alphaproteobacteria bacterium]